ncbi:MAG: helix-turn-helix domain-containing protein [Rhodospirillaceae bacterium]|nr:MAG: helix-turn-helix domain-containing protein [Rhodospirillaceae bacterium]
MSDIGKGRARQSSARKRAPRVVRMFVFPDAHLLDISGPMSLFASANELAGYHAYDVALIARQAGPIRSSAGIDLMAGFGIGDKLPRIDTLLVSGGRGVDALLSDRKILAWLRQQAAKVRRMASVCSGALLLAEAGLLKGRRAVTHWDRCDRMAARYPDIKVERDPLFVRDGKFYSSAGISAGMDLALALIEEDLGADVAHELAREFVLYMRRSGGQAQFSPALRAQVTAPGKIKALQAWILAHLHLPLTVDDLAAQAAMSPRHFARRFTLETGMTPAAFVAAARLDGARQALASSDAQLDDVAHRLGFGSAERLRRTFLRHLSVTPTQFRDHFQLSGGHSDVR